MNQRFPLSYAQERFWFLEQIHPANPAYHLPVAIRLRGPLDLSALQKSLDHLAARQGSLRTVFPTVDGTPYQIVKDARELPVDQVDLSAVGSDTREEAAARTIAERFREPFDLERGPLTRVLVLHMGPEEAVLFVCQHHIISDAGSVNIFLEELSTCYAAFRAHREPDLPHLRQSYATYSMEQRRRHDAGTQEEALTYWRSQLGDCPTLDLPTDRPRPRTQSFDGDDLEQRFGTERVRRLRALAAGHRATPFMVLIAVLNVLLCKHSGQRDVVIGTPIEGRHSQDTERVQGLFLNTLALRTAFSDDLPFSELLKTVKSRALEAYAQLEIPFERLIEALKPPRDPSRTPFFQVMLNMHTDSTPGLNLPDVEVERYLVHHAYSKFDMTLYVTQGSDDFEMHWTYNRDLFDEARIRAFCDQYLYVLDQVQENPGIRIDDVTLVTPAARALLPDPRIELECRDYPPIVALVRQWSQRSPESCALSQGDGDWSYRELLTRSERMARQLVREGVRKGDVVAITGRPSCSLFACVLASWLAGGVVLTVREDFPSAYKTRMVETTQARFVIAVDGDEVDWANDATVLGVEREPVNDGVTLPEVRPDDGAYIFLTSGTTAMPRAVLGTHNGLSHFLHWQRETFEIQPADRFAQITALSFDVVLRDVFLPLSSGSTLVIPERNIIELPVLEWLQANEISRIHAVPSLLRFWLGEHQTTADARTSLKTVFSAGEPLDSDLVNLLREKVGQDVEVANLYGPTETTLAKSCLRIPNPPVPGIQSIGRALPNSQVLVLNNHDQRCGLFEPGEICVRTPYRTRGYLNSPTETFVQNPWKRDATDRIYHTGDIGWHLPDGNVAIVGRKDDLVKIRGVRVDPRAASDSLARHADVRDNVVLPLKLENDEYCLVAYVVASTVDADENSILEYLHGQLPPMYVPTAIVLLDEIPLTANGKVDKRSLPAPTVTSRLDDGQELPEGEIEERLVKIWTEVFGVKNIGMLNTFFGIGGHSLLAVQLLNRIREAFQVELSLTHFFENPTVRETAAAIDAQLG